MQVAFPQARFLPACMYDLRGMRFASSEGKFNFGTRMRCVGKGSNLII